MYDVLIEPLAAWKWLVDWGSVICAVTAAVLWWRASMIRTPAKFAEPNAFNVLDAAFAGDVVRLAEAVGRQSRWNAWAATFAGGSAFLVGLSTLIGARWL
jgi:hypothetical protein